MLLQNILSWSKMTRVWVSSASILRSLNLYLQLQFFLIPLFRENLLH